MPEHERIPQDDWVDQDILTRAEAAERLAAEIKQVTAELAGSAAGDEILARRLTALKEAYAQMAGGRTDTPSWCGLDAVLLRQRSGKCSTTVRGRG